MSISTTGGEFTLCLVAIAYEMEAQASGRRCVHGDASKVVAIGRDSSHEATLWRSILSSQRCR